MCAVLLEDLFDSLKRSMIMFQRILVPLDGSARAERALPVAARLAQTSGGSIVLLQVVNQAGEKGETERASATGYLNTVATSEDLAGIKTHIEVIAGKPDQSILESAKVHNVDLIVICTHGRTGFQRWAQGSVTHTLAHETTIPLLVLHERESETSRLSAKAAHALCGLVALDGSALAEEALLPAAHLVAALAPGRGALYLTLVVTDIGDEAQKQAKAYQAAVEERVQERLNGLDLSIRWFLPRDADVAGELLDIARGSEGSGGCDFIAMSTHGRGGLERWMMGSITEHMLNATKLPMLIVRPQNVATK